MNQLTDAKVISESLLGTDLTIEECDVLSKIVVAQKLNAKETLFEPGTKDGNLYLLVEGKLDIFKDTASNKTIHITTLKQGAMIGELSFIDDESHSMRLVARKDSSVLTLSKTDFESLLSEHPNVVYNVMRSILRYSHKLQRKMLQENLEMQRMVQNEYM